jgi:hypothetical protein
MKLNEINIQYKIIYIIYKYKIIIKTENTLK